MQENGRLEVEYQTLVAAGKSGSHQESIQEEKVLRYDFAKIVYSPFFLTPSKLVYRCDSNYIMVL